MNGIGVKIGKKENILDLYKSKQEFTKPSVKRRLERKRRKANSKRYSRRVKY
jgi:hypothetical protein